MTMQLHRKTSPTQPDIARLTEILPRYVPTSQLSPLLLLDGGSSSSPTYTLGHGGFSSKSLRSATPQLPSHSSPSHFEHSDR